MRDAGVLKEAYGRFGRTGPEFEGWLSNHGPMAAEAMVRHGHDAAVDRWIDRYEARLEEAPSPRDRIPVDGWRAALGDPRRLGDWPVFFAEQLDEADWRTVLGDWWPRLLPGIAAGATQPVGSRCRASRRPAGWGPRTGCVVSPACRPRTSTAASTPAWPGSTSCPGGRRRRAPWERRRRTRPWGFLRELVASAVQDHAERAHTGPEELMDVAVRHGDEHLVKLTDTALDVWSWTGDPAALAAVRRAAALIQPPG